MMNRKDAETVVPISAPTSRSGAKRAVSAADSSAMPAQASTTTVEWPGEKNRPTPVGFWPCPTSLRVTLSMAAIWSASTAWRRPSV